MKKLILSLLFAVTSTAAFAEQMSIGDMSGSRYSEFTNTWVTQHVEVFAEIDDQTGKRYVNFVIDGPIQDQYLSVEYGSESYQYIVDSFKKGNEWGNIARDNRANVSARPLITSEKGCAGAGSVFAQTCSIDFAADNDGLSWQVMWYIKGHNGGVKAHIAYTPSKITEANLTLFYMDTAFEKLANRKNIDALLK